MRFLIAWIVTFLLIGSGRVDAQSTKRGVSGNLSEQANGMNSRWNYRWHFTDPADDDYNHSEWVPMLFAGYSDAWLNNAIDYILDRSDRTQFVLGFNEPERTNQGFTTLDRAVEAWQLIENRFAGTGIQLVSPAVSDNAHGRQWLADFMSRVEANDLQVDAIAFHWYGNVNINNPVASGNQFLARVDDYHNTYGRPVWITEFAGVDWGSQYTEEQMANFNAAFLEHVIPELEARDHVHRYAWFQFHEGGDHPGTRLHTTDPYGLMRPTRVGRAYNPEQNVLAGESFDLDGKTQKGDYFFLHGGLIKNDGPSGSDASVGGIYTLSSDDGELLASSIGGVSDWRVDDGGFIRVETNSTLRKVGENTVRFDGNRLYVDGLVRLMGGPENQGELWISQPKETLGSGSFRLDAGSHLRLGDAAATSSTALPYDMQLRGGRISASGIGNTLSGDLTLHESTAIDVAGVLDITGRILVSPGGQSRGIWKLGEGTLELSGENTVLGNIAVNQGTLLVNGSTTVGQINVAAGSVLGGNGAVDGLVQVDGLLSPGTSTGTLTLESLTMRDGSSAFFEIASATDFDQLIVQSDFIIGSDVTLSLALLDGFDPQAGQTFELFSATSLSGQFGALEAPTLTGRRWDTTRLSSGIIGITAVPEPSGVLALSLVAVGLWRRRTTTCRTARMPRS